MKKMLFFLTCVLVVSCTKPSYLEEVKPGENPSNPETPGIEKPDKTIAKIEKEYLRLENVSFRQLAGNAKENSGFPVFSATSTYRYGVKITRIDGSVDTVSQVYQDVETLSAYGVEKVKGVKSLDCFAIGIASISKVAVEKDSVHYFDYREGGFSLRSSFNMKENIIFHGHVFKDLEHNSIDLLSYLGFTSSYTKDSANYVGHSMVFDFGVSMKKSFNQEPTFFVNLNVWVSKDGSEPDIVTELNVDIAKTKVYGGVTMVFSKDNTPSACASLILVDGVAINVDNTGWKVFSWGQVAHPVGRIAAAHNSARTWFPTRFTETPDTKSWGYYNVSLGETVARSIAKTLALTKGVSNPDLLSGKDYVYETNGNITIKYMVNKAETILIVK